jgi:hypothetical protein
MWLAIFIVSARGKRINYLTEVNRIVGQAVGELVQTSLRISPGKKKLAGETVWLALMPLQPAQANASARSIATSMILQFNLTWPV